MDRQHKRVLEAEKQEARKQRLESAKIASAPAQDFQRLPVFSPPKKTVANAHDPLKARVQSVLGQFEDVRPLLNERSVGVPLAPMTPVAVPSSLPLSRIANGPNFHSAGNLRPQSVAANQDGRLSQSVGSATMNGAKSGISNIGHLSNKGERRVTSSSDSLMQFGGDGVEKTKLTIKIPPDDTINKILQEMSLPAELSAIADTPTKYCEPMFPGVDKFAPESDSDSNSDSDSDGDPLLAFGKFENVGKFERVVSPSYSVEDHEDVLPAALFAPAVVAKSDSDCSDVLPAAVSASMEIAKSDSDDDSSSSGQVSDTESSASEAASSVSHDSTAARINVTGLSQSDGRPSVLVKLPLPSRLRKPAVQSPLSFDVPPAGQQSSQSDGVSVPVTTTVTVTAAAKESQLARDTIANIVGSNAHLPIAIKIPKKPRTESLKSESPSSLGSRRPEPVEDSRTHINSPATTRYGSQGTRRNSPPKSSNRRSKGSHLYTDFDQPSATEDFGSPYSAPSHVPDLESFGVPAVQDPYADFVPKSSDEEDNDDRTDAAQPPVAKRRCQEIGDMWGAQVSQSSQQQSQQRNNSKYAGREEKERKHVSRNAARHADRRYNRNRDSDVDRPDRNDLRREFRSGDYKRQQPRYHRGADCRDASTSPNPDVLNTNKVLLCDKSSGRTPNYYADDEVQTDVVDEPMSTDAGRCQHLSLISDNLQKTYLRSLQSAEYYYTKAKKMKHTADAETDLCLRSLLYLESVLLYAEHIYCLQQKKVDKTRLYKTYLDTYTMSAHNSSSRLKHKITMSRKWHIVDTLSLRVQSYLREQMWQLKQSECQLCKDVVNNYTKDKVSVANGEVSSVKSDSGSSEDSAPNAVPLDVMSSVQDYMNGVDNLVASTMLWSKADILTSLHCKDFFASMSSDIGDITRECHLSALVTYIRAGLERVRVL